MNPYEDDDYSFDEQKDDPSIRELRLEMARLQAQLDQLAAAARDRADEIAELRVRLNELEQCFNRLKSQYRRRVQLWTTIAVMYGSALGMLFSYFWR